MASFSLEKAGTSTGSAVWVRAAMMAGGLVRGDSGGEATQQHKGRRCFWEEKLSAGLVWSRKNYDRYGRSGSESGPNKGRQWDGGNSAGYGTPPHGHGNLLHGHPIPSATHGRGQILLYEVLHGRIPGEGLVGGSGPVRAILAAMRQSGARISQSRISNVEPSSRTGVGVSTGQIRGGVHWRLRGTASNPIWCGIGRVSALRRSCYCLPSSKDARGHQGVGHSPDRRLRML